MPAEQGNDAERFAAAIEQGRPPASVADPELARDLEIVAMLRSRGGAYAPNRDERARARQRLLAVLAEPEPQSSDPTIPLDHVDAPTTALPVVAAASTGSSARTGDPDATVAAPVGRRSGRRAGRHTMPSRPAGRAGTRMRLPRRALLVGTAALVALIAVAGGGIFASRDALPGDGLYPIKRVAESAGLAMTFGDAAKAHRELELATTRVDEVEQLTAAAPAGTRPDPKLVSSTMRDFDSATGAGSRGLLGSDAATDTATLGTLQTWAGDQVSRLSSLRSGLPAGALPQTDDSIGLLDRLVGRTRALGNRSSCTEVTSGAVDDLGPLPAQGACSPRPAGTSPTTQNGSSGGDPTRAGTSDPSVTSGNTVPGTGRPDSGPDATTGPGTPDQDDTTTTEPPSTSTPAPPVGGDVTVPVPLPLLPPVTLPTVVPGLPHVTIG